MLRKDQSISLFILIEVGEYWLDTADFSLNVDELETILA
jgi:hypothetical protein